MLESVKNCNNKLKIEICSTKNLQLKYDQNCWFSHGVWNAFKIQKLNGHFWKITIIVVCTFITFKVKCNIYKHTERYSDFVHLRATK